MISLNSQNESPVKIKSNITNMCAAYQLGNTIMPDEELRQTKIK